MTVPPVTEAQARAVVEALHDYEVDHTDGPTISGYGVDVAVERMQESGLVLPVLLPLAKPEKLRQSSIAQFDNCPLSMRLGVDSTEEHTSDLAARGTLFHRWVAKAIAHMRAHGENRLGTDQGLHFLLDVLAQRDVPDSDVVHLPMKEIRWLRVVVTRWCEGGAFNAQRVIAIEERLDAKIDVPHSDGEGELYERIITGQPDVLVADPPYGIIVVDWKSGWAPPARIVERAGNDSTDQTLSDQGYAQQVIYGLLVLENYPSIERVTLREAYLMAGEYREATIERWQMERVKDILGAVVSQIDAAFEAGRESDRWIAKAGTHCGFCPSPRQCPIREWVGIPTTIDEAVLAANEWLVAAEVRKERMPIVKGWVDANGPIPIDHGKGRREVGWINNKTGDGRSFKLYEPEDAPPSPFDERLRATMQARRNG